MYFGSIREKMIERIYLYATTKQHVVKIFRGLEKAIYNRNEIRVFLY